ncbi:preprotein translocase subunit YajC [Salisaeta longa]|uniref:preprotein translocase subunit YajC n=1 Tax=Salisaeta longa TaxID=503170 RepID=UPI0003B65B17|nr:preprotein translocase subunit YajC [Salisaeta longa]
MASSLAAGFILLTGAPSGNSTSSLLGLALPFILILGIFYLLIYRPQKKREREHQELIDNLERGDQIVTIGGIHGTIREIDDDSVLAQVDSKGVKLRIDKQAIASVGGNE